MICRSPSALAPPSPRTVSRLVSRLVSGNGLMGMGRHRRRCELVACESVDCHDLAKLRFSGGCLCEVLCTRTPHKDKPAVSKPCLLRRSTVLLCTCSISLLILLLHRVLFWSLSARQSRVSASVRASATASPPQNPPRARVVSSRPLVRGPSRPKADVSRDTPPSPCGSVAR